MGLFKKRPKSQTIRVLLDSKTKTEQKYLAELQNDPVPLKVFASLTNYGNIRLVAGKWESHPVGHFPAALTEQLQKKYGNQNGFSCDMTIGNDYVIQTGKDGQLQCNVTVTITP